MQLHGSFYALEGGSVADCLTDLTGGVATKVKLDNPGSPVTAGEPLHLPWPLHTLRAGRAGCS